MRTISLKGYVGERQGWPRFTLDLQNCSVEKELRRDANDAQTRAAGVGAYVKCGTLLSRHASFVALYTLDDSLYLSIDSRQWNLLHDDVRVERRNTLLGKRFRVLSGQAIEWQCTYLALDYEKFPDEDMLWYVARSAADRESRLRTLVIWQDIANGRWEWSENYHADLDRRVKALVGDV